MAQITFHQALERLRERNYEVRRLKLRIQYLERRLNYLKFRRANKNIQFDNISWKGRRENNGIPKKFTEGRLEKD